MFWILQAIDKYLDTLFWIELNINESLSHISMVSYNAVPLSGRAVFRIMTYANLIAYFLKSFPCTVEIFHT